MTSVVGIGRTRVRRIATSNGAWIQQAGLERVPLIRQVLPLIDVLLRETFAAIEVVVNMIAAFCPGVDPFLPDFNRFCAESTPELLVAVTSYTARLKFSVDKFRVYYHVLLLKVVLEALSTIAHLLAANILTCRDFLALPCLEEKVLTAFMPLPVILAAEGFGAPPKGTCIGFCVSPHMFSKFAH